MKKWMRTAAYGLLMVMAVGSVGGKAYPVMAQKKEATVPSQRHFVQYFANRKEVPTF